MSSSTPTFIFSHAARNSFFSMVPLASVSICLKMTRISSNALRICGRARREYSGQYVSSQQIERLTALRRNAMQETAPGKRAEEGRSEKKKTNKNVLVGGDEDLTDPTQRPSD